MADYDTDVALRAQGYNPQDAVAPLQAYMMAQEGHSFSTQNQLAQLKLKEGNALFDSQQALANGLKNGGNQLASLNASGMGAFDPEGASRVLGNIQSTNTLSAISKYATNPNDPNALAGGGPTLVNEGAQAQGSQQDALAKQANLRGRIALGYMQSASKASSQAEQDMAWHTAVGQAHAAGLIPPLTAQHGIDNITDAGQRMTIARQWAASGADSVVNSGDAAGNTARETTLNTPIVTSPGQNVWSSQQLKDAYNGGQTPTTRGAPTASPNVGRSVAADGTVPVAPAPGNGSRPIAGGFVGGGQGGTQPPVMTQAESDFGLPSNYLSRTAQIESGGRANASNPSGAAGLFQFMPSTWARYGEPGKSPLDPQAATVAAARLAADNQRSLTQALGRPPTAAELYLSHQQGPAGAAALLKNPNAPAASIVGAKALIANGGTPSMTAGQFAGMWEKKFNGAGNSGNFSLSGPSPMGSGVSMPAAAEPSSLPGAGGTGLRTAAPAPPPVPAQPDLAPPVAGPVQLPSSAQPMPNPNGSGRSAADEAPLPATRPLAGPGGLVPLVSGMTPFQLEKQHLDAGRAVQEETSARDQFVAAGAAQSGLMQLQEDLTKLTPGSNANLRDTLLAPGSGADTRIGLAKTINSTLASVGRQPFFDPEKITAAESAAKTSGRLGFDLAGGLGKGEAGYIVNQAIGLNPSVMSTPQGAKLLIGSLMATQQRQKDLYLFQGEYARANDGNPIGAEVEFDQSHSPMHYVQDAQRLSRVPLPAVKYLQAHPDQGTISSFNSTYGPSLARYYLGSRTD